MASIARYKYINKNHNGKWYEQYENENEIILRSKTAIIFKKSIQPCCRYIKKTIKPCCRYIKKRSNLVVDI